MLSLLRNHARTLVVFLSMAAFSVPQSLLAQSHVVSPSELQKATVAATQARQQNVEAVQQFLAMPKAQKALKSAGMDPQQVKQAVAQLNDQELAQLAARSTRAQADFAAGNLSDRDLILILIGIAALILIIVAVR